MKDHEKLRIKNQKGSVSFYKTIVFIIIQANEISPFVLWKAKQIYKCQGCEISQKTVCSLCTRCMQTLGYFKHKAGKNKNNLLLWKQKQQRSKQQRRGIWRNRSMSLKCKTVPNRHTTKNQLNIAEWVTGCLRGIPNRLCTHCAVTTYIVTM